MQTGVFVKEESNLLGDSPTRDFEAVEKNGEQGRWPKVG